MPFIHRPLFYWTSLISAALTALMAICVFGLISRQQSEGMWVRHSLLVLDNFQLIQTLVLQAESAQRGYLITGRDDYLLPYTPARENLRAALDSSATLVSDSQQQTDGVRVLRQSVASKMDELDQTISLRKAGNVSAAYARLNTDVGLRTMDKITNQISALRTNETKLLTARESLSEILSLILQIGASIAVLTALVFVALIFYKREAEPKE